jgi:hypothetical protein
MSLRDHLPTWKEVFRAPTLKELVPFIDPLTVAGAAVRDRLRTSKEFFQISTLKELFPIIGPITGSSIVAVVTVFVALAVTQRLATATKREEIFLGFTQRYHNILAAKHELDREITRIRLVRPYYRPDDLQEADAHQIYFQLFGLIYDEFYAYQHNFLEAEVLVDWMTWQMHDAQGKTFEIGGVSYIDGWKAWSGIPAVQLHLATPFMGEIQNCSDQECVRRVVMSYAPSR